MKTKQQDPHIGHQHLECVNLFSNAIMEIRIVNSRRVFKVRGRLRNHRYHSRTLDLYIEDHAKQVITNLIVAHGSYVPRRVEIYLVGRRSSNYVCANSTPTNTQRRHLTR